MGDMRVGDAGPQAQGVQTSEAKAFSFGSSLLPGGAWSVYMGGYLDSEPGDGEPGPGPSSPTEGMHAGPRAYSTPAASWPSRCRRVSGAG